MQRLILWALRWYGRHLSRFTPRCPQTPSCSTFAVAAVREHGAREGLRLAVARVEQCGKPAGLTGSQTTC